MPVWLQFSFFAGLSIAAPVLKDPPFGILVGKREDSSHTGSGYLDFKKGAWMEF